MRGSTTLRSAYEPETRPLAIHGEGPGERSPELARHQHRDSIREVQLAVDSHWTRAAQIFLGVALDHRDRFRRALGRRIRRLDPLRHRSSVAVRRKPYYLKPRRAHQRDQLAHR